MSGFEPRLGIVTGLVFEADIVRAAANRLRIQPPLVACAGPGGDRARRAAEELIAQGVTHLLSFGIAAGLDPTLQAGSAIVADAFRRPGATEITSDRAWADRAARALPGVRRGLLADSEILANGDQKAALRAATTANIADMESYGVAEAAASGGLPCIAVRVISDGASQVLPSAVVAGANADGTINVGAVLIELLKAPGQLPALMRVARETGIARRRLRTLADLGLARSFFADG